MAGSGNDRNPAPSYNPWTAAYEYAVDAWQRSVLYADVMRQRGNQYHEHMAKRAPNVLSMESELVMDGRCLPRPVNYGLLRIKPPAGVETDPIKRPFLVVDPRAGHGPGIGGFKPESEIGVALRAGHPCYFATFLPQPMPTQTVEDVMMAEARFLEEIISLHPNAEGKPVVVANCQAGWQIMMTAAVRPELFGPIIVAGAPLSYWAGWRGMNPMRYAGGLLGGSWLTAMTSDLGDGKFDGAWLVQNFENLNPANTLWSKQYNLYSKVDTEAERYLSFEKWWGGHVFLNGPEIQYIVDNLFVGNRLATAGLVTSDGIRIDLRNIRSPIVVFCSKGDNITPPPQALGWIPDLYQDEAEVLAHGQTIVYAVHESIGHLGIFVSGSVARKEHQEFTSNIDMIDVLPPGIYQAEIADKTPDTPNADLAYGNYVLSFEQRTLDDVRAIVERNEEDDRRFAAVARISDINLGMYRSFVQPWLRALVTPQSAEWSQRLHPLRLPYELISDRNPLIAPVAKVAQQVREHRRPATSSNPFLMAQEMFSNLVETSLNIWQELRDSADERTFMGVYGSPIVQDLAGLGARSGPPRKHPGVSPRAPPLHGRTRRRTAFAAARRRTARRRDPDAALRIRRRRRPGRAQLCADPQDALGIQQRAVAAGVQGHHPRPGLDDDAGRALRHPGHPAPAGERAGRRDPRSAGHHEAGAGSRRTAERGRARKPGRDGTHLRVRRTPRAEARRSAAAGAQGADGGPQVLARRRGQARGALRRGPTRRSQAGQAPTGHGQAGSAQAGQSWSAGCQAGRYQARRA
jgi:hypothetical protein